MMDELRDIYDAIVVGGGPAGLNGPLMLGRSRRSVLLVDVGAPRNLRAEGSTVCWATMESRLRNDSICRTRSQRSKARAMASCAT